MERKEPDSRRAERVSSTEFKNHYGKYIKRLQETDQPIEVTKNGTVIFTVIPPEKPDKLAMLNSLVGIIPDEGQTRQSIREERMREKHGITD